MQIEEYLKRRKSKAGKAKRIHVYPLGSLPHDTDGGLCWCRPDVVRYLGVDIVVHKKIEVVA